jgi:hypothetical protein
MPKSFEQWINESGMNRDLSQPITIELEAGRAKVYADPEAENWSGESVRTELYTDMLEELRDAVKEKQNAKIKSLLQDLRETPLFGQDTSNTWKQSHIDGVENKHGDDERRKWAALYAIRKIELFLDWVNQNA